MTGAKTMRVVVLTGAFALVLTACQNNEPLGQGYGDSIERNAAVQVINPAPERAGQSVPDLDGVRAAGAIERYNTGKVIDAHIDTTTKSISSGAGAQK